MNGTLEVNGTQASTMATVRARAKVRVSSDSQSMTNGLYILAAAHCSSVDAENMFSPAMIFSSRLSFEDA